MGNSELDYQKFVFHEYSPTYWEGFGENNSIPSLFDAALVLSIVHEIGRKFHESELQDSPDPKPLV
jgi:hypothetical protein